MYNFILNSPIGNLGFKLKDDRVCKIDFLLDRAPKHQQQHTQLTEIARQCEQYFCHQCTQMTIPFILEGTPFQQKVWQRMYNIPYGQTMTYGELARELKTSAQAVGNACRANPVPLIVPCHRILGASNKGGFAGATEGPLLEIKLWLLNHES